MALDSVLSSYDSHIADLTGQIAKIQGQYNYLTSDKVTLIDGLIATLYTHNGANFSIYYNKMQDYNKQFFDQEQQYLNQTFPNWTDSDFFNTLQSWQQVKKDDLITADKLKTKIADLSGQLKTVTDDRNGYLNNLPTVTADQIKQQADLSNRALASDIEKKQTDAKLAQDKLKSDIYSKSTTLYVVIGVVVVAIVFAGVIVYKKFFK
jgi:hypothetical protein